MNKSPQDPATNTSGEAELSKDVRQLMKDDEEQVLEGAAHLSK